VLSERFVKQLPRSEVRARFRQIVQFEQMLMENGVVLLKFFLHLSRAEQGERLRARLEQPHKRWKFSSADLETRRKWKDYMHAYEEMLNGTNCRGARWHIVPADHKWYRDLVVARAVVKTLVGLKMKWPKPKEDLSKIKIK
jgi:polyphosphate kinase 2 (PPK2 family)